MLPSVAGFAPVASSSHPRYRASNHQALQATPVTLTVDLPPTGSDRTATVKLEPALTVPSEFVEVRYPLPFDLSVEPKNNLAVCTKAGAGGEQVGDVLRYTSQWTLGLPQGDGLITTAAAFSGTYR
jgi:hypothetical protein